MLEFPAPVSTDLFVASWAKFYQTHLSFKYTYLLSVFQNYAYFHLLKGKGDVFIFKFVPIDHFQSFHTHTYP